MDIVPYEDFSIRESQLKLLDKNYKSSKIKEYFKKYGVLPDRDTVSSFVIPPNLMERYKQYYYARYYQNVLEHEQGDGDAPVTGRNVLIYYGAGFNTLSSDISNDINYELKRGYVPSRNSNEVLLVFSHLTNNGGRDYSTETSPALTRLYTADGSVHEETLITLPAGTPIANKNVVTEILSFVKERFPDGNYGVIFASHATGWLPEGYYSNQRQYEGTNRGETGFWSSKPNEDTVLRSFAQEYYSGGTQSEEIEIRDLASAIPYKLDYILFDACLMATVEVAWELRNKCNYLIASPCEIPSPGFNYQTVIYRLLQFSRNELQAVCEDYYTAYENDSTYGATITMVDTDKLEGLATVCKSLFEKYRSEIRNLDGRNVQVYDRMIVDKRYYVFFDLKDMLREAGATENELSSLQNALSRCIVYEAHTPRFINIKLYNCCGLSMYLPAYPDFTPDSWHGTEFLDSWYKENISWNQETSLVTDPSPDYIVNNIDAFEEVTSYVDAISGINDGTSHEDRNENNDIIDGYRVHSGTEDTFIPD